MKRISSYLLFLSLFALCALSLTAQTRARRVGDGSIPTGSSTPITSRPPVLGGANGTTNSQQSKPTTTADGPEEVEAGDIIKVNTTLVTLPAGAASRSPT